MHNSLLFDLRKVKTNGNIYVYFEIVLNRLAFNLQPLYGTFNFIVSCPFLFVLNVQKFGKDNLLISGLYYIIYIKKAIDYIYIYVCVC